MDELPLHNKPYVKAGSVAEITRHPVKLAYNTVMAFSRRTWPIFDKQNQAKEWLITQ
jgi:hypothetical protein